MSNGNVLMYISWMTIEHHDPGSAPVVERRRVADISFIPVVR